MPYSDSTRPYDRKRSLSMVWSEHRPEMRIFRAFEWYEKHDQNVILLLRLCVTIAPIVLLQRGFPVEWVVSGVVAGIFVTEYLSRKHEALEAAKVKFETKKEYQKEDVKRKEKRGW